MPLRGLLRSLCSEHFMHDLYYGMLLFVHEMLATLADCIVYLASLNLENPQTTLPIYQHCHPSL